MDQLGTETFIALPRRYLKKVTTSITEMKSIPATAQVTVQTSIPTIFDLLIKH